MHTTPAQPAASSNLRAALRYAQCGFPVLLVWPLNGMACSCPKGKHCPTPGKHPIVKAWPKQATVDAEEIKQMFKRMPNAHVGIMPPEGHCIVDIDPRNGGTATLKALLEGEKLPPTPVQNSGGGGLHLFFKGAPAGPLGKGIDVKRPGRGYVVAWPAAHTSGGEYQWRTPPWDVKPAALPACLQQRSQEAPHDPQDVPTGISLDVVRQALAHVNADDYARWVNVGQALRYTYGDAGQRVWEEWSQTSSKWQDGDDAKWETFDRNRDRPLITVRSIISMARRSGYRPLTSEFNESLWALGDISGLLDDDAPPLDWVIAPCMPAGKVVLLSGAGGSSKSFFALTLGMQLAIGEAFGPFKPSAAGKVVMLVAEEDKSDIHRRLRAILRAQKYTPKQQQAIGEQMGIVPVRGFDWRLVFHDEAHDLHETERVDYLIDEVRALGDVRLLVLDPLVAFNGANENDNMEMARLMFTLDRIAARTGAAVLVLHHVSKGGQITSLQDATQAVVRGASALVDNARAALLLTRMPRADAPLYGLTMEDAGRFVVCRVMKNNYGPHVQDMVLAVEQGGALRLAPEVRQVHATTAQARAAMEEAHGPVAVLQVMQAAPQASQSEWAQAARLSVSRLNRVLHNLLEDGHVRRLGVGRGGSRYEITQTGRQLLAQQESQDLM